MASFTLGMNEFGLLSKLAAEPYKTVWGEIKRRGITSVEICALFNNSETAREKTAEMEKRFSYEFPPCVARGNTIYELVDSIRTAGLQVVSCHLMGADMYPEYITEAIPYLKEIHARTGIGQFVISCMFDSEQMVQEFLPGMEQAAAELTEKGITLCYHNHHMDCLPLETGRSAMEMIWEGCPSISFQLDIGWSWYGSMDPEQFIRKHGERITSLHLKDFTEDARSRKDPGRFTAIGSGAVPTAECLKVKDLCSLAPDMIIIDQDASCGDIYDDISSGTAFVRTAL
mgnify:CR=1 FL=1